MQIQSLLDTDLYKFTMMQTVLHKFPGAMVKYQFKCRGEGVDLRPYAPVINQALDHLCTLRFTREELAYLRSISFFNSDFVDFLRIFELNREFIHVQTEPEFGITIQGPWLHTILFEVPVLAIISECYSQANHPNIDWEEGKHRLTEKIALVKSTMPQGNFKFSDFGTRRRFSFAWQQYAVERLSRELPDNLTGTSNLYFAKAFNIKPIGTMAHEYLEACQALGPKLALSQKFAFDTWAQEYRGELGIALSDVINLKAFLKDFDLFFCKLFDGARHDSGDPFLWGDKVIEHYKKMRIDPKTKTLVFSDKLDFPLAIRLYEYFYMRTNPVFGIGTNITNDLGYKYLQIVIKMVECNGQPVAKISDNPEKVMSHDPSYLAYLKKVFNVET